MKRGEHVLRIERKVGQNSLGQDKGWIGRIRQPTAGTHCPAPRARTYAPHKVKYFRDISLKGKDNVHRSRVQVLMPMINLEFHQRPLVCAQVFDFKHTSSFLFEHTPARMYGDGDDF